MGKASRWIINLLLGKKEEREKKKNISFYEDFMGAPNGSIPSTPIYKRRWSFGKSASKEKVVKVHKSSKSLDSIIPIVTQHAALLGWEKQLNNKNRASAEAVKQAVATRHTRDRIIKSNEDAAATRIQAAYRSHLARKALNALKALVKLQALVRGNLVRKRTTATLRKMHALMAIQVRARFQRVQMAEESTQLAIRSQSSRVENFPIPDNEHRKAYKETVDLSIYETKRILKDNHGSLNHSQLQRREHGVTKYYSGELYFSNSKHEDDEFSFPTALNSPHICSPTSGTIPGRASFTYQKPDYMQPISHPNYMSNTESSRAKVRSHSEPKRRPKGSMRSKNKAANSMYGKNAQQGGQRQGSSSHSTPLAYEYQDTWSNRPKDSEHDAESTASTSHSNYSKILATYENMY